MHSACNFVLRSTNECEKSPQSQSSFYSEKVNVSDASNKVELRSKTHFVSRVYTTVR